MIESQSACTFSFDEPQKAAEEILGQLDLTALSGPAVGLMVCTPEFVRSGAVRAVCQALPFEVIGCTAEGIAFAGESQDRFPEGSLVLVLRVLTGRGCRFAPGVSDFLRPETETRIEELYSRLSPRLGVPADFLFVFQPHISEFAGDRTVVVLDRLSGGVPLFGAVVRDEASGGVPRTIIFNGEAYHDRMALLLISGMESRFDSESLTVSDIRARPIMVTASEDNKLIGVNNKNAASFMENIGVISSGKISVVSACPIMVDNHDGEGWKVCAIYRREEGGALRCGVTILPGAALRVGNFTQDEVLQSTRNFIGKIKKNTGVKNYFIISCFGRSVVLVDINKEAEMIAEELEETGYLFFHAAGEFCPVYDGNGRTVNRFFQYSIISAGY
ncbi:MAG: hypothetical protein LBQ61_02045 [Spirochaetales bacterium]|jgi:hypothetical protein|nr:hypothetical protein [Spirochaetales bacterium]